MSISIVEVKVRIEMDVEEGISIDHIVNDMNYEFEFTGEEATILGTEMIDFDIIESPED